MSQGWYICKRVEKHHEYIRGSLSFLFECRQGYLIWAQFFFHPARKHGKILNRATLWFTNKWGMSTLKHLNLTKKNQKRTSLGAFKRQSEHELVLKWIKMDMKRNWNGPKMSLYWTKIRLFMDQKKFFGTHLIWTFHFCVKMYL